MELRNHHHRLPYPWNSTNHAHKKHSLWLFAKREILWNLPIDLKMNSQIPFHPSSYILLLPVTTSIPIWHQVHFIQEDKGEEDTRVSKSRPLEQADKTNVYLYYYHWEYEISPRYIFFHRSRSFLAWSFPSFLPLEIILFKFIMIDPCLGYTTELLFFDVFYNFCLDLLS